MQRNHSFLQLIHPSINYTNQSIKCKSNVIFIAMMLTITIYSTDVRREKVERVNFLMLIKVWESFVPLHSWKGSSKAETCMKMCDRTVLHVSSVVLLNSCRLPSPCFNCGFFSPDHLTLTTTILNTLSQLYNTYAAQCSSCGLRTLDIAKHLDWHFRSIVPLFILYQL